jgi:GNAT superfamily N-acetyltransferase
VAPDVNWPELLVSAVSGTIAATIALLAASLNFTRARKAERNDADRKTREERIARVHAAVWVDLTATARRWRGRNIGASLLRMGAAVSAFTTAEWAEHEAVARWVLEQYNHAAKAVQPFERWWLLPGNSKRRSVIISRATEIATALSFWEKGTLSDDWFFQRLSAKAKDEMAARPPEPRTRWSLTMGRKPAAKA